MKSLKKALSVFELIIANGRDLSLSEISNTLDLPKGTVHRILATMVEYKFARQDPATKRYGLGFRCYDIETVLNRHEILRAAMSSTLWDLYRKCKETVNASVLEGENIEYILRYESEMVLRVAIKVGTRFPAHCTSTGKVLLASLSDEELDSLYQGRNRIKKCTKNSIGSLKALKEALSQVRETGLAREFEECLVGVHCMASPILNMKGKVVAAVSVSGPKDRLTAEKMDEFEPLLRASTEKVTKELGGK